MNNNKNIKPLNNKEQRHGYWERYYDGKLWFKRFYHNGKIVGYEEEYWCDGQLQEKTYHL
jgi:antitoxin component YwqK of YwqJK toxin-antitoxin module